MQIVTTKDLWQDSSVTVITNVVPVEAATTEEQLPQPELALETVKPEVAEAVDPIAWIDTETV